MPRQLFSCPWGFAICVLTLATAGRAAEPLCVRTDFEGASARVLEVDQSARIISIMPGGNPERGWPCWWSLRIDGMEAGETITLRLQGSTAARPHQKPLAAAWAMPARATLSADGETWVHSEPGRREGEWMVYTLQPHAASVYVAWGPPYTPSRAAAFVRGMSEQSPHATAAELCRSRGDRPVPMLQIREGDRPAAGRFGVWVQARQHAWESGSSWVAQGFAEWLLSEHDEARWLRQHAEITIVPIMDVDNSATGNGGKDEVPHDHNRDWSSQPHWHETIAAQRHLDRLIGEGRMDLFLDLHNPAPQDPTFFYVLTPELIREPALGLQQRFLDLASARIAQIRPRVPMRSQPKLIDAAYHPLWRQISANWVAFHGNPHTVSLCLETGWNHDSSTTTGYRAVGASLAAAVREYLGARQTAR